MSIKVPSLDKLVHELSRLPGIGEKTAIRLAYHILKNKETYPDKLSEALQDVKSNVHLCQSCYTYTETEICNICSDSNRNSTQICVVEESFDISKIEASGKYRGRFHVLGGALSPIHGITPAHLKITELVRRIEKSEEAVEEVILALDADLEGDTTALYVAKILEKRNIKISRLAHGIPFGSDIDYIDHRTLSRAFENRVEMECPS